MSPPGRGNWWLRRSDAAPVSVEKVHAVLVERQREPLADLGVGHAQAFADGDEGTIRTRIEIEESVLAEWLDQAHGQRSVVLAAGIDADMLGPDAQSALAGGRRIQPLGERDVEQRRAETRDTVVANHLAGHEVH